MEFRHDFRHDFRQHWNSDNPEFRHTGQIANSDVWIPIKFRYRNLMGSLNLELVWIHWIQTSEFAIWPVCLKSCLKSRTCLKSCLKSWCMSEIMSEIRAFELTLQDNLSEFIAICLGTCVNTVGQGRGKPASPQPRHPDWVLTKCGFLPPPASTPTSPELWATFNCNSNSSSSSINTSTSTTTSTSISTSSSSNSSSSNSSKTCRSSSISSSSNSSSSSRSIGKVWTQIRSKLRPISGSAPWS